MLLMDLETDGLLPRVASTYTVRLDGKHYVRQSVGPNFVRVHVLMTLKTQAWPPLHLQIENTDLDSTGLGGRKRCREAERLQLGKKVSYVLRSVSSFSLW